MNRTLPRNSRVSPAGTRLFHVTPLANLPGILAEGLQPKLGPRSARLGEPAAGVYCFNGLGSLEAALGSWLWDAFDDESEPPALLAIALPEKAGWASEAGFEVRLTTPVPPGHLRVLSRDLGSECDLYSLLDFCREHPLNLPGVSADLKP